MRAAFFDLDNTLLGADSDYAWRQFLVDEGLVGEWLARMHDDYYRAYLDGKDVVRQFLELSLLPLAGKEGRECNEWRSRFMRQMLPSLLQPEAIRLLEAHRRCEDRIVIVTATNSFVAEPIAECLGADDLLATAVELSAGQFTGRIAGEPCHAYGKAAAVRRRIEQLRVAGCAKTIFYGDSTNDIPVFALVDSPIAVDPKPGLLGRAQEKGWRVVSLRSKAVKQDFHWVASL
jgi:HAD superfamily hydrolase (TIGR01490 family)